MLLLSSKVKALISGVKTDVTLGVDQGRMCAFPANVCDELRVAGFLNVVFFDKNGCAYGFSVDEFEKSHIKIVGQEKMRRLNSSEIVGLSRKDDRVFAQHWEGFRTEFKADDLTVIGQTFTK